MNNSPDTNAARAFVYAFLARAFAYPRAASLSALAGALDDLDRALATLDIAIDDLSRHRQALAAAPGRLHALGGAHNSLFATGLAAPAAETAYELDKAARRAAELADIQGFYRAFGVGLSAPVEPDGLSAELEFMSLLAHKAGQALAAGETDGEARCRAGMEGFLRDHLGRWYGAFVERLDAASDDPFYRALSTLLQRFLDSETARLPIDSPLRADEGRPGPDSAATWHCPAAFETPQ